MATGISLDEARTAVLTALDDAVRAGVVNEQAAARQAQEVRDLTTLFALDEWVFAHPTLKSKFCRYPECFNPPRPPVKGGHPPAYCAEGRDEQGHSHDDAQRSLRRRKLLRKQAQQLTTEQNTAGTEVALRDDYPVTAGRASFTQQVYALIARFDAIGEEIQRLRDTAERATDEKSQLAEIEAIRNQAARQILQHDDARIEAERIAGEAESKVNSMISTVDEANDAAEQAEAAAEKAAEKARKAEEDKAAALAELQEMREKLQAYAEEVETKIATAEDTAAAGIAAAEDKAKDAIRKAEAEVEAAKKEFEQELDRRTKEMDAKVAEADRQRDEALDQAEQTMREADLKVEGAEAAVKDARQERDTAKETAKNLQSRVDQLLNAAIEREQHFHDELETLRAEHREEIEQRLAQERSSLAAVHEAQAQTLHETINHLRTQLAADEAATAENTSTTDTPDVE